MAKAKGKVSIGQMVVIVAQQPLPDDGGPLQGEPVAAGVVAFVDGNTINAHVFAPKGPMMTFFTGLLHVDDRDALPDDDPNRNAPAWRNME